MNDLPIGTVEFSGVSKRYRLGGLGTLRGTLAALSSKVRGNGSRELWALDDVSFRIEPGSILGLIGPNGAGKTTALKLLSNITQPTMGRVSVSGRVSSLIELGAGFHPELTGRENIFLNGAILGLSRREIRDKLDQIIAFSELERFIDTPVKRYSSGMYVRLGFAVAAHVAPDVLLVDEVLAVGDASFRQRCIEHMRALRQRGVTIIFVSHNLHLIRSMCDTAMLLVGGRIQATGTVDATLSAYESALIQASVPHARPMPPDSAGISSPAQLVVTSVQVLPSSSTDQGRLLSHQEATVRVCYQARSPQQIGRIDVRTLRADDTLCSAIDSLGLDGHDDRFRVLSGRGMIDLHYRPLQLTTGRYYVLVQITDPSDSLVIAAGQSQPFDVSEPYCVPAPGLYVPRVQWTYRERGEPNEQGLERSGCYPPELSPIEQHSQGD